MHVVYRYGLMEWLDSDAKRTQMKLLRKKSFDKIAQKRSVVDYASETRGLESSRDARRHEPRLRYAAMTSYMWRHRELLPETTSSHPYGTVAVFG